MKHAKYIALLTFTGIALFGAFLINHSGDHHGTQSADCFAAGILGNADCPLGNNAQEVTHHLNALQQFSLAVFLKNFSLLAIFAAIIFFAAWLDPRLLLFAAPSRSIFLTKQRQREIIGTSERFAAWFVLNKRSDPDLIQ